MQTIHARVTVATFTDVALTAVGLWLFVVVFFLSPTSTPIYNGVGPYATRFNPIVLTRTLGVFPLQHPGVMLNCAAGIAYAGFRCVRPTLLQSPVTSLHSFRIAVPNAQITWNTLVPVQPTRECMRITSCPNNPLFDGNLACALRFNTTLSTIVYADAAYMCTTSNPNITYANPFSCDFITAATIAACVAPSNSTTTTTTTAPTTTTATTLTPPPTEAFVCVVFGLVVPGVPAIAPTLLTEIWGTAVLYNTTTIHGIQIPNPYYSSTSTPNGIVLPNTDVISLYAVQARSRIIIVDNMLLTHNATIPDMTTATVSNNTAVSYWVFRSLTTCDTSLTWTTPLCANSVQNISYSNFTYGVPSGQTTWNCPPSAVNYVFVARPAFTLRNAAIRVVTVSVRDNLGNALTNNSDAITNIPCSGTGTQTSWVNLGPLTAINWTDSAARHNNVTTAVLWMHNPGLLRSTYNVNPNPTQRTAFSCTYNNGYSYQGDCSTCYGGTDYGGIDPPVLDFQPWSNLRSFLNAQATFPWRSNNPGYQPCWQPSYYLNMGSSYSFLADISPGDAFARRNNGSVLLSPQGTLWGRVTTQCGQQAIQVELAYADMSTSLFPTQPVERLANGMCNRIGLYPTETWVATAANNQFEGSAYTLGCTFLGTATLSLTAPVSESVFAPVTTDTELQFWDVTRNSLNYDMCTPPLRSGPFTTMSSMTWIRRLPISRAWDEFQLASIQRTGVNVSFPRNFAACDNRANTLKNLFSNFYVSGYHGNGFAYLNVAVAPFPRVTAQILPLPTDCGYIPITATPTQYYVYQ